MSRGKGCPQFGATGKRETESTSSKKSSLIDSLRITQITPIP